MKSLYWADASGASLGLADGTANGKSGCYNLLAYASNASASPPTVVIAGGDVGKELSYKLVYKGAYAETDTGIASGNT